MSDTAYTTSQLMRFMVQFLLGCIGAAICFYALRHIRGLHEMTGNFRWAENVLGTGGTITALRLIVIGLMVMSILYALHWF